LESLVSESNHVSGNRTMLCLKTIIHSILTSAFYPDMSASIIMKHAEDMARSLTEDHGVICVSSENFLCFPEDVLRDIFKTFLGPFNVYTFMSEFRKMQSKVSQPSTQPQRGSRHSRSPTDEHDGLSRKKKTQLQTFPPMAPPSPRLSASSPTAPSPVRRGVESSEHGSDNSSNYSPVRIEWDLAEHQVFVTSIGKWYVHFQGDPDKWKGMKRGSVISQICQDMAKTEEASCRPLRTSENVRGHFKHGCLRCPRWLIDFVGATPRGHWCSVPTHEKVPSLSTPSSNTPI
jgi:hypothetical protein